MAGEAVIIIATIDRFEDGIAVLDVGGQMLDVPKVCLPVGLTDGDRVEVRFSVAEEQ